MKKKTKPATSAKRFPRPPALIITAIAVVAIAAVTVVSRQSAPVSEASETRKADGPQNLATTVSSPAKVAGQDVPVDQTGQIKPLSPEEAQKLADNLKHLLNKSTEGLVEERHVGLELLGDA